MKNPVIVEFEPIPCPNFPEIPEEIVKTFSQDQRLTYRICKALISGYCPADLAACLLGGVNMSRWLTTGERVGMFYMTQKNPTLALKRSASFVVRHYAWLYFELRRRSRVTDAPEVFFQSYKRMESLTKAERKVVDPVIQRAYFWRHPESLLLACLASPRQDAREKAVERILAIRDTEATTPTPNVRVIEPPVNNFSAEHFSEMIVWEKSQVTGERREEEGKGR